MICSKCNIDKPVKEMQGPLTKTLIYPTWCYSCYINEQNEEWASLMKSNKESIKTNPFLKLTKEEDQ